MASQEGGKVLLHLYKRLLRSSASYPSKNRWGIYESIREEFRENIHLDPNEDVTKKKIAVAYKGLSQLRMYEQHSLGGKENPNWSVTLEQNPMPKPPPKKE
mmetsp:Transcript_10792/g.13656  ORF Transcript_10792/g.13656 Transcript_10792/m.13656 type:complete len:101 (+) Transcript_10792:119-421(+)|eukprot:CAMPEP_0203662692 /NCGR_PEP_ID=MMETSP0090-20130426/572_1 /ASSEMBLY_ACC=CAM_ASM_001088 /TAXON_ID=426623 /ORGANISM="Chaetoceros affinis, Strain CCMP159" /LENGTH=100 /DNA_ID=CAMNT_0050525519 /DNA_START=100 /DNA_END=402 /DNA_ORIENTATION=+